MLHLYVLFQRMLYRILLGDVLLRSGSVNTAVISRLLHQNTQQKRTGQNKYLEHFQTLDLPADASKSSVRQKYIELVKKHHPDKTNDGGVMFNKIDNAYKQLMMKFQEDAIRLRKTILISLLKS